MDLPTLFSLEDEVENYKDLLETIASGHSFAIINYRYFPLDEETNEIEPYVEEDQFYGIHSLSSFPDPPELLTEEKLIDEIAKRLKSAYDFNQMFSSLKEKGEEILEEVEKKLKNIVSLLKESLIDVNEIEFRYFDEGGHDVCRIDIKQNDHLQIFQFIEFID